MVSRSKFMTERKHVPIGVKYHKMLEELANANHRSMTNQVEYLIDKEYYYKFIRKSCERNAAEE